MTPLGGLRTASLVAPALLLIAGCGRGPASPSQPGTGTVPATAAAISSGASTSSPPASSVPATSGGVSDQQLNRIDEQLNQIDQQLSQADQGLTTSEGDPTQ